MKSTQKPSLLAFVYCLAVAIFLLWPGQAWSYDEYSLNGGDATNCGACHGDFRAGSYISNTDGQNWGNLHNLHRQTMVNGDCSTCHFPSRFPTYMNRSTGGTGLAALGCMGCHGRVGDNTNANPDVANGGSGLGAGLRQHHYASGVTTCATCHLDANPANYTPVGENVLPDYYANPGSGHPLMPTDSCNLNGNEDFAGIAEGLDNDGDGIYDGADSDCSIAPACGDGNIDPGEECDTSGESATCDADCTFVVCGDGTTNTTAGEACDTSGESATCDADCTAVACGDGTVNGTAGETCDLNCPTTCDDNVACTTDGMTGSANTCNVVCSNTPITLCVNQDGCCPAGCDSSNDDDCSGLCGNGTIDNGETCDPPASCPTTCEDNVACTADVMSGSANTCDVSCSNDPIVACIDNDGCCPAACDAGTDNDCSQTCGDGVVDPGETCDPPASCPTSCDDSDACTSDALTGSANNCNAECTYTDVTACTSGDGCCAAGCTEATDDDCAAPPSDGCGCAVGVHTRPAVWLGALFVAGLLLVSRRRRRR